MHINYKPADAWAGDFIPFFWQGEYHLFYLKDYRDITNYGEGYSWYHVSTKDFLHFSEHGEVIAKGTVEEQDFFASTGSVIHANGQFHIFYHGQNRYWRKAGRPEQAIMHAVSDDLYTWKKIPEHTFGPDLDRFEANDWRDPFVFWNEEAGEYWMVIAARLKEGPSRRRGCTGLCTSKDLVTWEIKDPFYAPDMYFTHECPDVFQMGDWWYLIFSEFSDATVTRYRMARSVNGPWITPEVDTFDNRAFYAAKTAEGDGHRYLFGWNPTQADGKDYSTWNWGSNLVVHEVIQRDDGTLAVRIPENVRNYYAVEQPLRFDQAFKTPLPTDGVVRFDGPSSFRCVSAGNLPRQAKIEATASFSSLTKGFGVMLRTSEDFEDSYYVRIEPQRGRLVFDAWPRRGDRPYMVELERPLCVQAGEPIQITIYTDGSLGEVYVNNEVAMSVRMYNLPVGNWGFFVSEGQAEFSDIHLSTP